MLVFQSYLYRRYERTFPAPLSDNSADFTVFTVKINIFLMPRQYQPSVLNVCLNSLYLYHALSSSLNHQSGAISHIVRAVARSSLLIACVGRRIISLILIYLSFFSLSENLTFQHIDPLAHCGLQLQIPLYPASC